MSDPEMTPSRTPDDVNGNDDDRRRLGDNATLPTANEIEDETVAIDPGSGRTQSPGDDDE